MGPRLCLGDRLRLGAGVVRPNPNGHHGEEEQNNGSSEHRGQRHQSVALFLAVSANAMLLTLLVVVPRPVPGACKK
jgi:hypothetical protein